jgi:hypothetical protein
VAHRDDPDPDVRKLNRWAISQIESARSDQVSAIRRR